MSGGQLPDVRPNELFAAPLRRQVRFLVVGGIGAQRAFAARGGAEATVLVAALDDIIASKEHADREKDREALPELYALRDRRAGGDSWAEEAR